MISGSYEVAWRFQEADPDRAHDLYVQGVNLEGAAMNVDLRHMGADKVDPNEGWLLQGYGSSYVPPTSRSPKPQASLMPNGYETRYATLQDERVLCIGAGAGSLIMGSYLTRRGVPPENVTFVDPSGAFGGIWRQSWARLAGFNNPKELAFSPDCYLDDLNDRQGWRMLNYLHRVMAENLTGVSMVSDGVADLQRQRDGERLWVATTTDGSSFEAESVVLATGRPHLRRIDGEYIHSNLDTITEIVGKNELIVERSQRRLTGEELASGRPIILIGLGNSTAAMLDQIHDYMDEYDREVPYKVLTHYPEAAVKSPDSKYDGKQSIFRKPSEGYLTGYSGDIVRDRWSYFRALDEGAIIPGVTDVYYNPDEHILVINTDEQGYVEAEPHIFAMIGYERDLGLFQRMGALSKGLFRDIIGDELPEPDIRRSDGAIRTYRDGFASNAYAIGAVAADKRNPNAAVIPGIQAQAPATTLTIATRNMARKSLVRL